MRVRNLMFAGLALAGLFVAGMGVGKEVKASIGLKIFRIACIQSAFAFPPADGSWNTVACITVSNKKAGGIVKVIASGMSVMAAGDYLTLTLATAPASRGAWVQSFGYTNAGFGYFCWTHVQCFFGSLAGANTFYLNVADFSGVGGSDIEMCAMVAIATQNPLTEDCSAGEALPEGLGTGSTNR